MKEMNAMVEAKKMIAHFQYEDNLGIAENTGVEGISSSQAKQCATIAVELILEFIRCNVTPYTYDKDSMEAVISNRQHYNKVKQEIEKL